MKSPQGNNEDKEDDTRRVYSTSNEIWMRDIGAEQRYDG